MVRTHPNFTWATVYVSYTSDFAKNAERAISAKQALHVLDCLSH